MLLLLLLLLLCCCVVLLFLLGSFAENEVVLSLLNGEFSSISFGEIMTRDLLNIRGFALNLFLSVSPTNRNI